MEVGEELRDWLYEGLTVTPGTMCHNCVSTSITILRPPYGALQASKGERVAVEEKGYLILTKFLMTDHLTLVRKKTEANMQTGFP